MAPASTNLLVQPFVLMIGAGVLIWLLGYSAIVGIGVSSPCVLAHIMLIPQLLVVTAGPVGEYKLQSSCTKHGHHAHMFSQDVHTTPSQSPSTDKAHRQASRVDGGDPQQLTSCQVICL
jgi:hypothetical protein